MNKERKKMNGKYPGEKDFIYVDGEGVQQMLRGKELSRDENFVKVKRKKGVVELSTKRIVRIEDLDDNSDARSEGSDADERGRRDKQRYRADS